MEIEVLQLSPTEIVRSDLNPRKRFEKEPLESLTGSIRDHGVLQPVGVRSRKDGRYELIWGERRWRAATMVMNGDDGGEPIADMVIPASLKDLTDQEVFELQVLENIHREALTVTEEARAYARAVEFGDSPAEVARKFKRDKSRVGRYLQLLDLPAPVLSRLDLPVSDEDHLPLYVAMEAVRVPAEVENGQARARALQIAEEVGTRAKAREVIESRFLRPLREKEFWKQQELPDKVEGDEVLSYERSRQIFPPGVVALTPISSDGYVDASACPPEEILSLGADPEKSWGEWAEIYGVPRVFALDGEMNVRTLVSREQVIDSAVVAHQFLCRQEGTCLHVEGGYEIEGGERMMFWVPNAGEWLPRPLQEGRPYRVSAGGVIRDMEGKEQQLRASGDVGAEAPFFYGINLDSCSFAPSIDGARKGVAPAPAVSSPEESVDEPADPKVSVEDRAEKAASMLRDLDEAVRLSVAESGGNPAFLALCGADLAELAIAGFSGNESPYVQLLLALDCPEVDGRIMDAWPDFKSPAGYESATVCAFVLYWLNLHEGPNLEECKAWQLALEAY